MSKKINIGVFNDCNIPSHFAHSFNLMKMAQAFQQISCETEVVSCNSITSLKRRLKYGDLSAHYGLDKPVTISWKMPSIRNFISGYTQDDKQYAMRAAQYAKAKNFDLVYARSFRVSSSAVKQGCPTVMETHTIEYDKTALQEIYEIADNANFLGLVTIHEKIAKEHAKRGIPENKLLVLEDGVDLTRFKIKDDKATWRRKLGWDDNKKYAVYCGHLYKEKGIDVIIAAAENLKKHKNIQFILAGGLGKDINHWKAICEQKNLKNISFTGFLKNNVVPYYLKAADCLLLPYSQGIEYKVMDIHTTSPLKLFEYMASNRPIVATNTQTISKILTHNENAVLTMLGDINAFSDAVFSILNQPIHSEKLAAKASLLAENFTWDKRCESILQNFKIRD